jgi:hypothetical protein
VKSRVSCWGRYNESSNVTARATFINIDATEHAVFEYLYRDAANFKAWGQLLIEGVWTDQCQRKLDILIGDGRFVAEQVGIPALYSELYQYSGGHRTVNDHAFHEFDCFRQATDEEMLSLKPWGTVEQLLMAFEINAGRWDVRLSPHAA